MVDTKLSEKIEWSLVFNRLKVAYEKVCKRYLVICIGVDAKCIVCTKWRICG